MTMISVMRVVGALAAVAFAGQLSLAMAADEEPKKEAPKKEAPTTRITEIIVMVSSSPGF